MYTRQVKAEQYYLFKNNLDKLIRNDSIQVYHQCDITIDGVIYRLQLLLLKRCRIMSLKAIQLNIDTHKHELITDPMILGALTEFAILKYGVIKWSTKSKAVITTTVFIIV